jgi:Fe-S-cluster-containing dehydrogenase component
MARLSILIDVTKCSGCYNCFLACRDEYYANDYPGYSAAQPLNDHFWMQIKEVERGIYPKPKISYIPVPCMQCQGAPCIKAADNQAVYRRKDGIVIIDPDKAKGQSDIVNACPYRVIFWNVHKELPQKCTLCAHRLDAGEKLPRCVESCPTGALVFGDLDDPKSEITKLAAQASAEEFHPEYGTKPLVRYIGLPRRFVAGEVVRKDKADECLKGAEITLEGEGIRLRTQSDGYGDFEFEGLAANGAYTITVEYKGYAPRKVKVNTQTDVNLGEVVLKPAE